MLSFIKTFIVSIVCYNIPGITLAVVYFLLGNVEYANVLGVSLIVCIQLYSQ